MSTFQRAISYAKPYKKSFFTAIFFNVIYAIFNVIALGSMMPILSILFDEKRKEITTRPDIKDVQGLADYKDFFSNTLDYNLQNMVSDYGPSKALLLACFVFLGAFLFRNIFSYLSEYFLIDLRTGVSVDIRKEIHDKVLDLPVSYFTEKRKGDVIARITSDVSEVEGSILNGLVEVIRSPIMIIISFITLFVMSPKLTLFTIVVFPIMGTIISYIGKSLKKNAGYAQATFEVLLSYIDETLMGAKIIKIFNAEKQIRRRFNTTLLEYRKYLVKVAKRRALASPTSEFLGGITIAMLVYFGGTLSLDGNGLKGSEFVYYIGLFYTMLDPIKKFSKSISDIQKGQVSADRIFELMDIEISIKDDENSVSKSNFEKDIQLKNVYFRYQLEEMEGNEKWIINGINLTIPKGQTIALVGASGGGKTTVANLVARFYDVTKGSIEMDGVDIRDIKLRDYRSLFGMVTQDSFLFNDTIGDNIALGDENPRVEKIEQASEVANAMEFISKLDEALGYGVGEGGGKLSGGQKQRISIARAVYKNPPIMILDEATSALDTQSEKWVQDALENVMKDRTTLVIAHRLSTVMNADKIVVIDNGKIIEEGTHNDLITKDSKYSQLVKMQNLE